MAHFDEFGGNTFEIPRKWIVIAILALLVGGGGLVLTTSDSFWDLIRQHQTTQTE